LRTPAVAWNTAGVNDESTPTALVAGVDGCPAGWIAALREVRPDGTPNPAGSVRIRLFTTFARLLGSRPRPARIAVDMPIGLLDRARPGGRACDIEARRRLGPRASSVFSPSPRAALQARRFEETRGHGLSIQGFYLLPKIRELDRILEPSHQRVVIESHPELAFARLAGQPMRHRKKTEAGRRERLAALRRDGRVRVDVRGLARLRAEHRAADVKPDDLVDALVLSLVAEDHLAGTAARVPTPPAEPERDARGLRMEIWY
jgi:predicted RNase H-like nuclease